MAPLLSFFKKSSLSRRIESIQSGSKEEREKLIAEYIPFIIKTASDYLNRYIESENSDEYSIAMQAFNEAIDKYDSSRGTFIRFAKLIIHSRLKDYFRKNKNNTRTVLWSQLEENHEEIKGHFDMETFINCWAVEEEIQKLEQKLETFRITLTDLVKEAPKHKSTRINGIRIAKYIAENEELKKSLLTTKMLPSSKIMHDLNVTYKILNRSRKFIIATVLILDSNLEALKDYISRIEGGAVNDL